MSVEMRGLDNVLDSFDKLTDTSGLIQTMGKACALVERSAKQKAPKDTGALRRSITSKVTGKGSDIVGTVSTPLEYAPYVEYGTGLFAEEGGRQDSWTYIDDKGEGHTTSGQKPQPFMRPALDENRENIKRILKEGFSGD